MDFFDKLTDTVYQAGKTVGQKTKDVSDVTKLNFQIRSLEREIQDRYMTIGRGVYEAEEAGKTAPDQSGIFDEIRDRKAQIADLRDQVKAIKGVELCPYCGKEIGKDAKFCPHCGEKLEA